MNYVKQVYWCADFETTSNTNLQRDGYVRVWLWSLVSTDGQEYWGTTLEEFLDKAFELKVKKCFFHNLRFDGYFILDYLVNSGKVYGQDFKCIISELNVWYELSVIRGKHTIQFWDSLKKFPGQSVNSIAKMYNIEGKKEKPFFDLYRPEGYTPTTEEVEYCLQDSRIIAYATRKNCEAGNTAITLSSDAFNEVKQTIGGYKGYRNWMPVLPAHYDKFVRLSYKGGWTYLRPDRAEKIYRGVKVYDINSLYPWAMSECPLPYGRPVERSPKGDELYIISFECEFDLKPDKLPTIQVKNMPNHYKKTEYICNSVVPTQLYLTSVDYELFKEHYDIIWMDEPEYLVFKSKTGLLRPYIDYWMQIKEQATIDGDESLRYMAKRKMNSPYGKTGMKPVRINKVPKMGESIVDMTDIEENTTDPIYVPYASFVCAQARNKTIRSAQQEYDNFIYADTDSLHLLGDSHDELEIHPTKLGAWKHEGTFELAKYLRPKTYIHAHNGSNGIVVDEIKCAGMQDEVKAICTWDDFKIGTVFPKARKLQKRVKGGLVLVDEDFTIKDNGFTTRF